MLCKLDSTEHASFFDEPHREALGNANLLHILGLRIKMTMKKGLTRKNSLFPRRFVSVERKRPGQGEKCWKRASESVTEPAQHRSLSYIDAAQHIVSYVDSEGLNFFGVIHTPLKWTPQASHPTFAPTASTFENKRRLVELVG